MNWTENICAVASYYVSNTWLALKARFVRVRAARGHIQRYCRTLGDLPDWHHPLDPPSEARFLILSVPIRLLIIDDAHLRENLNPLTFAKYKIVWQYGLSEWEQSPVLKPLVFVYSLLKRKVFFGVFHWFAAGSTFFHYDTRLDNFSSWSSISLLLPQCLINMTDDYRSTYG